ncbi:hypothetical protein B0H14DRAFT_3472842 [Mycena olivaceomarginata]|nr:hypothetical protein B0H14DRAFT_3472842 [Mycena olivaceomarginata]
MLARLLATTLSATFVHAHLAPWHKGMYGLNGVTGSINYNTDDVVHPLYQLPQDQWWFHGYNGVPNFPPADGDFLELPAGKSFMVEIASNRGETTLHSTATTPLTGPMNVDTCITSPNMHTQNETQAAGTAFAISYTSDIKQVTPANLVVFTVRYHTPWKRVTYYDVPADMPACPAAGVSVWGWVPNGCGQPNMYHLPYRCKVTGATSTKAVGTPKPPVWCENNPDGCTKGPKQMIYWNQNEGNNIQVDGLDAAGEPKSPAYNAKCGFPDGAQNDIFTGASSGSSSGRPAPRPRLRPNTNIDVDTGAKKVAVSGSSSSSAAAAAASASGSAKHVCKTRKARRAEAAERERRSEGVLDASQAECARLLGVLRPRSLSFCRPCPPPLPPSPPSLATSDSLTHTHAARTTSTSHRYPPPWIPIGTSHLISSPLFPSTHHMHAYIPRSLRAAITQASSTHARQPTPFFVVAQPTTSMPLDSEALVVRSIVSDGEDRMHALDAHIVHLQATLAQLSQRRDETVEHLRVHRASFPPSARVPMELVCAIFALASTQNRVKFGTPPWRLGFICRSWRHYALSYPLLWSSVTVECYPCWYESDRQRLLVQTSDPLSRATNASLDITGPASPAMVQIPAY